MLVVSCLTVVVAYFLHSLIAVAVFCACFGYILSLDLSALCNQLVNFCKSKIQKKKTTPNNGAIVTTDENQSQFSSHIGFGWQWGWKELLVHFVMLILIGGIAGACSYVTSQTTNVNNAVYHGLGYTLIGLLVIEEIFDIIQSVYIFGIFRNPLFPCNVQSTELYSRRKRLLHRISYIWRILSNIGKCTVRLSCTVSWQQPQL